MSEGGGKIDRSSALRAALVFLLLGAFFMPLSVLYEQARAKRRVAELDFTARQLLSRITVVIGGRVNGLSLFARWLEATPSLKHEDFVKWAGVLGEQLGGFYGVNWIDPSGAIAWVSPVETNAAALGHNLMERDKARPYLLDSRAANEPRITPLVNLFQGPLGFAAYAPVRRGDEFLGWVNGVFAFDDFFERYVMHPSEEKLHVSVRIAGDAELAWTAGKDPGVGSFGHAVGTVFNQEITVTIRPEARAGIPRSDWTAWLLAVGMFVASLLVTYMSYHLMVSRQRLAQRLDKEMFQGVLLNLLVHDIVNPLFVIRHSVDAALRVADPLLHAQLEKTKQGVEQLGDVVQRVRDLRAIELGRTRPKTAAVSLDTVVREALALFEARFAEKRLTATWEAPAGEPQVLVDRVLFRNNVLANVLSNAAKFSEVGGTIRLSAALQRHQDREWVVLTIADEGVGIPTASLPRIFRDERNKSQPGTRGEVGTGIGMLQIGAYMRLFGGRVRIASRAKAESPSAHGTSVILSLPRALPEPREDESAIDDA
jgi:signal transduction histidine kinase